MSDLSAAERIVTETIMTRNGLVGALIREQVQDDAAEVVAALAAAGWLADPETTRRARLLEDVLGELWLYVGWHYVTEQLSTEHKEAFADAVDAWRGRLPDDEPPTPVERWWRDDEPVSPIPPAPAPPASSP